MSCKEKDYRHLAQVLLENNQSYTVEVLCESEARAKKVMADEIAYLEKRYNSKSVIIREF